MKKALILALAIFIIFQLIACKDNSFASMRYYSSLTATDSVSPDSLNIYSAKSNIDSTTISDTLDIVDVSRKTELLQEAENKENIISNEAYYPNPFSPEANIYFSLPKSAMIHVKIYNFNGHLVRDLVKKEFSQGHHSLDWDGKDNDGNSCLSGIYFYRVSSPEGYSKIRKLFWMK